MNRREKVRIDRTEPAFVDVCLRASCPQVEGLIRADVQKRAGEIFSDLGEPAVDQRLRTSLAGRDHMAVRRLREVGVLLILEDVVKMSERLLLRDDHDVKAARERL